MTIVYSIFWAISGMPDIFMVENGSWIVGLILSVIIDITGLISNFIKTNE